MNLPSSDPFEVDMDLLRRVGAIRTSLQTFQSGDPDRRPRCWRPCGAPGLVPAARGPSPIDCSPSWSRCSRGSRRIPMRLRPTSRQPCRRDARAGRDGAGALGTASLQLLDNAARSLLAAAGLDPRNGRLWRSVRCRPRTGDHSHLGNRRCGFHRRRRGIPGGDGCRDHGPGRRTRHQAGPGAAAGRGPGGRAPGGGCRRPDPVDRGEEAAKGSAP